MKTVWKWAIGIGVGTAAILVLIGLLSLLIKFLMKRCQKKPWNEIRTMPKLSNNSENMGKDNRTLRRNSLERQPLCLPSTNNAFDVSDQHLLIPVDDHNTSVSCIEIDTEEHHEHSLIQIQRERLMRLKEEENRLRPIIHLNHGAADLQRVIDQAQKEFDETV